MHVLLLGGTGNLGRRLLPALLAHKHSVTAYVRSPSKLHGICPAELLSRITVVVGDATDIAGLTNAIRDNECDAIVNCAGNMVAPWREQVLWRIAKAVGDAAVVVGRERGEPLRAWMIGGITSLVYPGTGAYLIDDFLPFGGAKHHHLTAVTLDKFAIEDLRWSLLCVGAMTPTKEKIELLDEPAPHHFEIAAGTPPGWKDTCFRSVPLVGVYLNIIPALMGYTARYEDVADFLAEDLERGAEEWVGKKVGYREKEKV